MALNYYNSFQNKNKKATYCFALRPLVFMPQQDV